MEMQAKKKLSVFFSKYQTVRYKKRETLFRPGDIPQGVDYILKGYARLYTVSSEGKELTLGTYDPGSVFPVVWALKGVPSRYYFECLTDLVVKRAPQENFIQLLMKNSDVFYAFTTGVTSRFETALRRMEWLAFGNAKERTASILTILAEWYGKREGRDIIIQIPLTHRDIAAFVGMTRETVSVEMKKFENKKLIIKKNKLYVVKNYHGLREESHLEE